MAIQLDPGARSQLTLLINEYLKAIDVFQSGVVYSDKSAEFAEQSSKILSSETMSRLERLCGDRGIVDYVHGWIYQYLARNSLSFTKSTKLVPSVFSDTVALASEIVDALAALPEKVLVVARLPRGLRDEHVLSLDTYKLSSSLSIANGKQLKKHVLLDTGFNEYRFILGERSSKDIEIIDHDYYFIWQNEGFVGSFKLNSTVRRFQDLLRALMGSLIALNVIDVEGFFPEDDGKSLSALLFDNKDRNTRLLRYAEAIDTDIAQFYVSSSVEISFWKPRATYVDIEGRETTNPEYGAQSSAHSLKCESLIDSVKSIWSESDQGKRLQTACLWLYRANVGSFRLDSLLQSTIAMEVLLGDRENAEGIGLTRLLANRCAYLLGENDTHRKRIMSQFTDVYGLRSRIVHSGVHEIKASEKELLHVSMDLAKRVICREMSLVG